MKRLFGGINLTWLKLIIMAVLIGMYTAIMAMLPIAKDTSFSDLTVTFEVWIFFGIFIIMNSKSPKDSALKCLIFFTISQPLIYLFQDLFQHSKLFLTYYRFWIGWTMACIPMGYIGYYMKKDNWWSLLILIPMLLLLGVHLNTYFSDTIFSFPRHLLTTVFCVFTLIVYPLIIFNDKKIKIVGTIVSTMIIIVAIIWSILNPFIYSPDILVSNENQQFDDTYKVYFVDRKYGDLSIRYEEGIESWMVHAELKKSGKTEFILESPNGEKNTFEIIIRKNTYSVKKKRTN